jgi:hypothetical protein
MVFDEERLLGGYELDAWNGTRMIASSRLNFDQFAPNNSIFRSRARDYSPFSV